MSRAILPGGSDQPARARREPVHSYSESRWDPVRCAPRHEFKFEGSSRYRQLPRGSFIMAIVMIIAVVDVLVAGTTWYRDRKGESG